MAFFPRLLRNRRRSSEAPADCYYFDGSRAGALLARYTAWTMNVRVSRLEFRWNEVDNESDPAVPLRLRLIQDLFQVQKNAMDQQVFQRAVRGSLDRPRLRQFLAKKISNSEQESRHTARRALLLIHICAWETGRNHPPGSVPFLFLERIPWLNTVFPFAQDAGVNIFPVRESISSRTLLRRMPPRELVDLLRLLYHRGFRGAISQLIRNWFKMARDTAPSRLTDMGGAGAKTDPKSDYLVAVEYLGQLNLDNPERHSNFLFWQQSSLTGSDLKVAFTASSCPLDQHTQAELDKHGMSAVVTHHGATTLANEPVFSGPRYRHRRNRIESAFGGSKLESKSLNEQLSEYDRLREYWTALFKAQGIRVFVTYTRHDPAYCAIADALESLGGITVNYQRSHQSYASLDIAGSADIVFNVSQSSALLEIQSGSGAEYHVVTGYLGDHRFPMLQDSAREIRDSFREQGATHVLAFFDEGSVDDPRWGQGHYSMRENYSFLLGKVLTEPWFGLVIKPKTPISLRKRLGLVNDMLEQAVATGRCFIFEDGGITGWYPPAAAALAADLAVHSELWVSTAGLEAALAGTPTLLLDREGWQTDPLYRLGVGQVVFRNQEEFWEACTQHWTSSEGLPGFGDWSSMLDELDPFRDGRAAERMGNYIKWLIDGLRTGLNRDSVMADAAERYAESWGQDKVIVPDSQPQSRFETQNQPSSRVTIVG